MQILEMYSVPYFGGELFAIVPSGGLSRLINDDPIWDRRNVVLHWTWIVPPDARIRVSNRIKFFTRPRRDGNPAFRTKGEV